MLIFLDTEFTDFWPDRELISLGMFATTGEEFYAELPVTREICSDFVLSNVLPLLGQYPNAACGAEELGKLIRDWLGIVRRFPDELILCYDSQSDWDLFIHALDYCIPSYVKPRMVADNIHHLLLFEFFEMTGHPEHHALYDAQANEHAFRERP